VRHGRDRIKCGARIKDVLETKLKRLVCDGKLILKEAQHAIATNWIGAFKKCVDKEGCPEVDEQQSCPVHLHYFEEYVCVRPKDQGSALLRYLGVQLPS
jgi:hypothetical protein